MKEYLIEKYEGYINNLEWHLETNGDKESDCMIRIIKARIDAFREMLTYLKML